MEQNTHLDTVERAATSGQVEVIQQQPGKLAPAAPTNDTFIHPMSAICLIALDYFWSGGELLATPTGIGLIALSLVLGVVGSISVTIIERGLNQKPLPAALGVGVTFGLLAAVPYPVMGTIVGVPVLVWSGLKHIGRR